MRPAARLTLSALVLATQDVTLGRKAEMDAAIGQSEGDAAADDR